jgi:hypothetical protein
MVLIVPLFYTVLFIAHQYQLGAELLIYDIFVKMMKYPIDGSEDLILDIKMVSA